MKRVTGKEISVQSPKELHSHIGKNSDAGRDWGQGDKGTLSRVLPAFGTTRG